MSVFDNLERPDVGPHPQDENDFDYLNRSGRPEAERVRALVEDWISRYPTEHRDGLISRLRSTVVGTHRSAFFELLLHELLIRKGHAIIEIEPMLPGTARRPDFLARTPEGACYYLEVVMARGLSDAEVAAERRLNSALRAIDDTPSPQHFLDLRVRGTPRTNVSVNKLRRELAKWIAALPEGEAAKVATPFKCEQHGMQITIVAWPRNTPEKVTRSIGVRHFGADIATRAEDIRGVIEFKARRYGRSVNLPLLVAVSGFEKFSYDDDAVDVLLGTEIVQTRRDANGTITTNAVRKPDGVWHGPDGPRRTVLSGALWFKQIDPWNFAKRDPLVIANPWAEHAAPELKLGLREWRIGSGEVSKLPNSRLGEVLRLPPNWPEE